MCIIALYSSGTLYSKMVSSVRVLFMSNGVPAFTGMLFVSGIVFVFLLGVSGWSPYPIWPPRATSQGMNERKKRALVSLSHPQTF